MEVALLGSWHLAAVSAGTLASLGHHVRAQPLDPIAEPGLDELLAAQAAAGRLREVADEAGRLTGAAVLYVAIDTPVGSDDRPDVELVEGAVRAALDHGPLPQVVVVASQVPPGTTTRLAGWASDRFGDGAPAFAHLPENLRLGSAVADAATPGLVVAGVDGERGRALVAQLVPPGVEVLWTSTATAELAKAARNAHLATTVALSNELATLADEVGADATVVAQILRADPRIGPHAYVRPGAPFSGGTLARDLVGLADAADAHGTPALVLRAALAANRHHAGWPLAQLRDAAVDLPGAVVVVAGLTYKAGTDALRRSWPLELCEELVAGGAEVRAWDPALNDGSAVTAAGARWCPDLAEALAGADALVVGTSSPPVVAAATGERVATMRRRLVLDPGGDLRNALATDPTIEVRSVGQVPQHPRTTPC